MTRPRFLDWRRVVIYSHRWLGIAGCLLFAAWFASGIVMMYARMPELSAADRWKATPRIDAVRIEVAPDDAARALTSARANTDARPDPPARVLLGTLQRRPVYKLLSGGRWAVVFADSGAAAPPLDRDQAVREAADRFPAFGSRLRYDAYLTDPDQWTLEQRASLPLHRLAVGDASGTVLYLSASTGEPLLITTASSRRWGYLGAVVHWLYFTPLRRRAELWAQLVIWAAVAGTAMCGFGLVWGVWRYARRPRYRLRGTLRRSPYVGAVRWHHYAGLIFGVTTATWVFSGLLSMDPWDWHPSTSPSRAERDAFTGGPLRIHDITVAQLQAAVAAFDDEARDLELVQFEGKPYLRGRSAIVSLRDGEGRDELDRDRLIAAAARAHPDAHVVAGAPLATYDAYYYDRAGELPLPVLRVQFDDRVRTWLYVDLTRGPVRHEERLTRLNRWLYHGLHSFDFPFLYYRRPLWDIVVLVLLGGGLVSSLSAVIPAWRRLRRHARRVS